MSVVLDASAVAAWAFADERSAHSMQVLQRVATEGGVAPAIWPFEVANLLLVGLRRGRITDAERSTLLGRLGMLPIELEPATLGTSIELLRIADHQQLTAYDAAYAELAVRRRLPLVTKDGGLITADGRLGIEIIPA